MAQKGGQEANTQQPAQNNQAQDQGASHYKNSDLLLPGEEVLIDARPAWSAWAGTLLAAGGVVILTLITGESAAIAMGLLVASVLIGYVWYQRRKVRYLITDQRVMVVTGISSRQTNEAWLRDVNGMQTGASFIERFLGHGHIMVSREILPRGSFLLSQLRGQGMKLGGISNYEQIAQVVRQRQAEQKR